MYARLWTVLLIVGIVGLPGPVSAQDAESEDEQEVALTRYEADLAAHAERLGIIGQQLDDLAKKADKPEVKDIRKAGESLLAEVQGCATTVHAFVNSPTRRGLMGEFESIDESVSTATAAAQTLFELSGQTEEDLVRLPSEAEVILKDVLQDLVRQKLARHGLEELLEIESLNDVRRRAVEAMKDEARKQAVEVTSRVTGMGFYDVESAREAIKTRLRRRLLRSVEKLVVKLGGNQLLVTFAGEIVVDWLENDLWPKLREWLRPKGNLHQRVPQSVATIRESKNELNALGNEKTPVELVRLTTVDRALTRAEWRYEAARYLVRDLPEPEEKPLENLPEIGKENKATPVQLANLLHTERESLKRNISITRQRFLLHKLEQVRKAAEDELCLRDLAKIIRRILANLKDQSEAEAPLMFATHTNNPLRKTPAKNRLVSVCPHVRCVPPESKEAFEKWLKEPNTSTFTPSLMYQRTYLAKITCNDLVRYSCMVFTDEHRMKAYGRAALPLPDGIHTVKAILSSTEGFEQEFEYKIEVAAGPMNPNLAQTIQNKRKQVADRRAQYARNLTTAAKETSARGLVYSLVDLANELANVGATVEADDLLTEAADVDRAVDNKVLVMANSNSSGTFIRVCEAIGSSKAYELARPVIDRSANDKPPGWDEKRRLRTLVWMYDHMASLAMGATCDVEAARKYALLRIEAVQGAGDYKDDAARNIDLELVPPQVAME